MEESFISYGTAARAAVAGLKELIAPLDDQVKKGEFPGGELNDRRVNAVKDAIKAVESAKEQPELRSIPPPAPQEDKSK